MPAAARLNDVATHMGKPLNPGTGSPDVEIGGAAAWRALPAGMGAGVESALKSMKQLIDAASLDPMSTPSTLARVNAGLTQDATKAASSGAAGAPGAVAGGFTSLMGTNAAATATYVAAAAVPGGEPAARAAYTKAIQAAAAAFSTAAVNAIGGMTDIHVCPQPSGPVPHGPGVVTKGSQSVLINNLPACRVGDEIFEAAGGADAIKMGCDSVIIGDDVGAPGEDEVVDERAIEQQMQAQSIASALVQAAKAGTPLIEVCPQCGRLDAISRKRTHWIALRVVLDESGAAVPGVRMEVMLPDGSVRQCTTGADGRVEIDDLQVAGVCSVACALRDARAAETYGFVRMGESAGRGDATEASESAPQRGGVIARVEAHRVRTGETLESLARLCGMSWQQLAMFNWGTSTSEGINRHLREFVGCRRRSADGRSYEFDSSDEPGIVFLPRRWEQHGLATDEEHVICVKALRTPMRRLIITLLDESDRARPGVAYGLEVGERRVEAKTDAEGRIDQYVPLAHDTGLLRVDGQQVTLQLDQLEAIETVIGVQKRLNNLRYECGAATGEMNLQTAAAVREFQERHELEATGEVTPETRARLKEIYGH